MSFWSSSAPRSFRSSCGLFMLQQCLSRSTLSTYVRDDTQEANSAVDYTSTFCMAPYCLPFIAPERSKLRTKNEMSTALL